jgi:hypothetical protein
LKEKTDAEIEDIYSLPPIISADRSNWVPPIMNSISRGDSINLNFELGVSEDIYQPTPRLKSQYAKMTKDRMRIGDYFAI